MSVVDRVGELDGYSFSRDRCRAKNEGVGGDLLAADKDGLQQPQLHNGAGLNGLTAVYHGLQAVGRYRSGICVILQSEKSVGKGMFVGFIRKFLLAGR